MTIFRLRHCVATLGVGALALSGVAVSTPRTAAASPLVDVSSASSVRAAWKQISALSATPTGSTGSTSTCKPGTISAAQQQATVKTVNLARALVGLGPVAYNTAKNSQEQSAALIMAANKTLNHHPTSAMRCYSAAGYTGASSSNLAYGANGPQSVLMYLDDPGTGNVSVGHRMWVLDPTLRSTAVGVVGTYSALNVFDSNTFNTAAVGPTYTAWPNAGYTPTQLIPTSGRWSLRGNSPAFSFSSASVKITAPNGVTTSAAVLQRTAGNRPYLVFQGPKVPTVYGPGVSSYRVQVSGIKKSGVATSYSYYVRVIDGAYDPTAPYPTVSGPSVVGKTLTAATGTWTPSASFTYQWLRDGVAISGATHSTYTLQGDDYQHQIRVRVTGTRSGATINRLSWPVTVNWKGDMAPALPVLAQSPVYDEQEWATLGTWAPNNATFTYQWLRNGQPIAGANGFIYTPVQADVHQMLSLRVTGARYGYNPASATSLPHEVMWPSLRATSWSGECNQDAWSASVDWSAATTSVDWQWYHVADGVWTPIPGATSSVYTTTQSDDGTSLGFKATGHADGCEPGTVSGQI